MINAQMLPYVYYIMGEVDDYGQTLPLDEPAGTVRMAVNIASQSVQDNIIYNGAQYVGLTHSNVINEKCVIDYKGQKLKVLYVNTAGRYNQIYMAVM